MAPGVPCGIGGDVSAITATSITVTDLAGTTSTYAIDASTTVTKNGQSAVAADIATGDNVHIAVSAADATIASRIDIVPAGIAGKVATINGDVLTISGPNGTTDSVVVSSTTLYKKGGASASLSDISVGTVIFAQGSFGSSATTVNATTVGIGQPGPGEGPGATGAPGGPPPGPGGPGSGAPMMKGMAN